MTLRAWQVANCPYLALAITCTGGHLGWFENSRTGEHSVGRWYVKPVVQFLGALLEVSGRSLP